MTTKKSKIEQITKANQEKERKAKLKDNRKKAKNCLKAYLKALRKTKGLLEKTFYCANGRAVFHILKHKTFKGEVLLIDDETIIITNKPYIK